MGFLIFSIPILILLAVLGMVHLAITTLSLVLGIIAVASDRGRRAGIAGIILTGIANVVTVAVVLLVLQASGVFDA